MVHQIPNGDLWKALLQFGWYSKTIYMQYNCIHVTCMYITQRNKQGLKTYRIIRFIIWNNLNNIPFLKCQLIVILACVRVSRFNLNFKFSNQN